MNERLLLRLPHRQMVSTFPKVLRGFFCHHRALGGEITRQVYAMIGRFYAAAAGCRVHSAAAIAYASVRRVRAVESAATRHRTARGLRPHGSIPAHPPAGPYQAQPVLPFCRRQKPGPPLGSRAAKHLRHAALQAMQQVGQAPRQLGEPGHRTRTLRRPTSSASPPRPSPGPAPPGG